LRDELGQQNRFVVHYAHCGTNDNSYLAKKARTSWCLSRAHCTYKPTISTRENLDWDEDCEGTGY